jgi:hypothetical protein
MPLYIVGGAGSPIPLPPSPADHHHSGWETPVDQGDNRTFKVPHGNYVHDSLDVAVAPLDDNNNPTNYDLQLAPFFVQTDPSRGLLTLDGQLPGGWSLIVRYIYH